MTDFRTAVDKIDLQVVPNAGLPASAYDEGTAASNSFSAVLAKAQSLMADGTNKVVFVAGTTDGWLFWNTDNDLHTPEAAIRLQGQNSLASFDFHDLT